MNSFPKRQGGVALITILLVVVIGTVLGVSMITEQKFAIARAQASFNQTIARQYAYGGEELARQILHQDFSDAPEIDHMKENWAQEVSKFEFDEGEVLFHIEDLQGKFNLNTLAVKGQAGQLAKQRFNILLSENGLDNALTDRIIDWIDPDDTVSALGAENYDYLGLERPYRSAGVMMSDVSELRLILELSDEQYEILAPLVTTLSDPQSAINVNTASPGVMVALAPGLGLDEATSLVSARDEDQAYTSLGEFTGDPGLGDSANSVKVQGLSVQSNFFQVNIRARYQDRFVNLVSIIQRDNVDGSMRVIYRNQSKRVILDVEADDTEGTSEQGSES